MWFKTILRRRASGVRVEREKRPIFGNKTQTESQFTADEALLRRLERLAITAQRTLAGNPNSGEHPSRHRMPATIFSDHRPYSHGDDYRTIDWNAYARNEQIVVRLGETEQDINVHILVDCSRSMAYGTPTKLVAAQQFAAAIGYVALAHSDRVRITPFRAGTLAGFGPAQGKGRAFEMLRFLGSIEAAGETMLTPALTNYARQHERGGVLVVCSDLLATPVEHLAEGLRAFSPARWQVLIAHTLDRRELSPELGDTVDLEDAETGERMAIALDNETITAYKRNVTTWQEQIATACAQRGAIYTQILTDWPLERTVVPYLRLRRVLQ